MEKQVQKRFGSIAKEKGFITEEQLIEALEIQVHEKGNLGQHRLIGQILMDKGYLSKTQLTEVLETMSNSLIYTIAMGR
jgi:hypothetical protein